MLSPVTEPAPQAPAVEARGLGAYARRGYVYRDVDLSVRAGGLALVTGPPGSGKTALLLTLTGRMRHQLGELSVLGFRLPAGLREVQHRSGAMGIRGLDELDEEVTVAATVRERLAWLAPWYAHIRTPDDDRVARLCAPVFGDTELPGARQRIHELTETQNLLLRIALAMEADPELIVVDEIDQLHDVVERDVVWRRLEDLADTGVAVVCSATSAREYTRRTWTREPVHIRLRDSAADPPDVPRRRLRPLPASR
ncbi:ATP-binding cassette domain-containing protein [Propionicicella superfundia]|uniref:ATP-binding cassette domain-containing protein n=1 Tax=Propionicicella superfundia TaxID=348582 RepID=UPI001FE1A1B8|nr:ATP-binding cassette domain-containing protein [Propionicicella superfundia]